MEPLRRFASIVILCVGCGTLHGCLLISVFGYDSYGYVKVTSSVNVEGPSPCNVNIADNSVHCTQNISIGDSAGRVGVIRDFAEELRGWGEGISATLQSLFDPLIVQVPAGVSGFEGTIVVGPRGVVESAPLSIVSGLTSIPIDANTNLVAEPGKQLVIIDFQSPGSMPNGNYFFDFEFPGTTFTTKEIKVVFAGKITVNSGGSTKTYYPPIYPCVTSFADVPALALPIRNLAQIVPAALSVPGCQGKVYNFGTTATPATVDVVEFYNASLDHYFITWATAEIANLDAGRTPTRWDRTGKTFKAYTSPQSSTSDICRYYIPPGLGDSHFFGRGTAECNSTGQRFPALILEDPTFMRLFLPTDGNCPPSTTPIYRVFSNRTDANHRYMTDRTIRQQMVASGWLAEGDGPDMVVMCAPQ